MPTTKRRSSLFGPTSRPNHDPFYTPYVPPSPPSTFLSCPPSSSLDHRRSRPQSLHSTGGNEVFVFSNYSTTSISLPYSAISHAKMTTTKVEVPSYISSRSANSLISYSRPTRIQAVTLHYLNKILDELLLLILTSAKSLATDRIKSDGILKVLGGQSGSGSGAGAILAKNAVLEAELELKSYLDGQRKEGGKMPLGLSATSRFDGTDTFPVRRAYEALRVRCQYYSTLGDLEDPSPHTPQDQNIMSTDGRPIATITPGVAIYVTALLEFVAEYILQNVGRVIERDNSDEAGLSDLIKAMEEDEGTAYWWAKLTTRGEMNEKEREEQGKGGKGRVGKPWKVPDASEYDEAAGRKKFQRQSLSLSTAGSNTPSGRPGTAGAVNGVQDYRGPPSALSSNGHESRDSSTFASHRVTSPISNSQSYQTDITSASSNASTDTHQLTRRTSTDKGWFGKRRGSFRSSQDLGPATSGSAVMQNKAPPVELLPSEDGSDDFESLMMSGQTMRVSLTPNRLRSIEKEKEEMEADGKRSGRRRPGTLSPLPFRDGEGTQGTTPRSGQPSPAASAVTPRISMQQDRPESTEEGETPVRSVSRQGSISAARSPKSLAKGAPPSAYRAVDPTRPATETSSQRDDDEVDGEVVVARRRKDLSGLTGGSVGEDIRLRPRDEAKRTSTIRDMVDMFNSTPPSPGNNGQFQSQSSSNGRESRMSSLSQQSIENISGRKSALSSAGGRMRSLFGRRTPSNGGTLADQVKASTMDSPTKKTPPASHRRGVEGSTDWSYNDEVRDDPPTPVPRASQTATDALTRGMLDGHARAGVRPGKMAVNMEDGEDEQAKGRMSKDVGSFHTSESGEARTDSGHKPVSLPNAIASQEGLDGYGQAHASAAAGNGATNGSAVVGLYQEPRSNGSSSELSSSHHHTNRNDPPSRKVPWSYSRQSSGSKRLSGTAGPMGTVARVGSGASSSVGHGSSGGDGAPPSAWSHGHSREGLSGNGFDFVKTPTPSAPATFPANSPRSPLSNSSRPSDAARTLSQLNSKMKEASTVEECRFLVTQALAFAAAAVHSELEPTSTGMVRTASSLSSTTGTPNQKTGSAGSAFGDIPDEEDSLEKKDPRLARASAAPAKDTDEAAMTAATATKQSPTSSVLPLAQGMRGAAAGPLKHRNLMLPMAVGYDGNQDVDAPSHKRQACFAAWLLDGEPFEEMGIEQGRLAVQSSPSSRGHSADEQETFSTADERNADSPMNPSQPFGKPRSSQEKPGLLNRRMSNVDSIRSCYRDASEGEEAQLQHDVDGA